MLMVCVCDRVCVPQTGIWSELCTIEENYLKPLRTGLNMSRAHYEAELKSTKEKKNSSSSAGQRVYDLVYSPVLK